jgi:SAM-dependent methyltransferase
MALSFSANRFDAAVMALVIFFVSDPAKGVAEMARVVCPGGMVATYVWDVFGGGFPPEPLHAEMRALGLAPLRPPRSDVSRMEALRDLWTGANLDAVETREIVVQRTVADFEDFWTTSLLGASIGPTVAAMTSGDVERLKTRLRARLPADAAGRITYGARANAIKGRVPR